MSDWLFPAIVIGRGGEFIADSGLRQPLRRMMPYVMECAQPFGGPTKVGVPSVRHRRLCLLSAALPQWRTHAACFRYHIHRPLGRTHSKYSACHFDNLFLSRNCGMDKGIEKSTRSENSAGEISPSIGYSEDKSRRPSEIQRIAFAPDARRRQRSSDDDIAVLPLSRTFSRQRRYSSYSTYGDDEKEQVRRVISRRTIEPHTRLPTCVPNLSTPDRSLPHLEHTCHRHCHIRRRTIKRTC